jgi:hypothetical protein
MNREYSRVAPPLLALALLAAAAPASAQSARTEPADKRIETLRQCRAIAEPAARLACFDGAAADLVAAADRGEVRVMDKAAVEKTKRRLFGFAFPDLGLFGDDDDEPEMDMLETTIATVSARGTGTWLFTTPEGGTWEIRNAPLGFRDPRVGDKVVFKRAALGSYFIRINDRIGVKGRRIG